MTRFSMSWICAMTVLALGALGQPDATRAAGQGAAEAERAPPGLVQAVARGCGQERLARAEAACVGALADTRILAMDLRIAGLSTGLQAASAAELSAFERGVLRSQGDWRRGMEADCAARAASRAAMPAAYQICRLGAALRREARLEEVISDEFTELAGGAGADHGTGRLELTLPLGFAPPGGPGGQLELELPISAN